MRRSLTLITALVATACVSAPEPCDPSTSNDLDQDGYFAPDDCEDDNSVLACSSAIQIFGCDGTNTMTGNLVSEDCSNSC